MQSHQIIQKPHPTPLQLRLDKSAQVGALRAIHTDLGLGHSMGSGIAKVPGGNPQKYLQVNTPVHTGSQHLNTHADGGGHLSLKNPPNPQVLLRKLPYLVIFTHMGGTSPSTGTCGSHPSQIGVTASVKKIPTGIICKGPCAIPYLGSTRLQVLD